MNGTAGATEAAVHLDTQRLAFIAKHVVLLTHDQVTGRWSCSIRGLALPVMGGTLEDSIDRAREFRGWAMGERKKR